MAKQKRATAAAALQRYAVGVPKRFSEEELEKRRQRLAEARKKRWPKKEE